MWIYYYASFGPGHQSNDYGFISYQDNYTRDDIKEHLFRTIDSCGYSIVLNFWEVERPPAGYVERKTKDTKEEIEHLKKYLNMLESISCFVSEEKDGEDPILIKNISGCVIPNLLQRLHKAGFMYSAEDISNWRYGKKCVSEPSRSKILNIMRKTKKYESVKEQLRKQRK
jgi:hypothetical protein